MSELMEHMEVYHPVPTCPGCKAEASVGESGAAFTCGCIPGLDYPEAPAAAPADQVEPSPEAPEAAEQELFDIGLVTEAWVEDQIEKELTLQAELERLGEQYLARVARKKAEIKEHQDRTRYVLEAWFDAQPKKGKSLHLATGTLKKKLNRGGPRVVDEKEALAWAEANAPKLVTPITTKKLDKDAFKKLADAQRKGSGEVLPGVEFKEDWESFLIDAPKPTGEEV